MNKYLYCDITGTTSPLSVSIASSHSNSMSQASFDVVSHTLTIGDLVTIDMGYTDGHDQLFKGYIKEITRNVKDNTYSLTAYDKMIRAIDYFIVSTDPNSQFTRNNISAEDLVEDLMQLAGMAASGWYISDPTHFIFGNSNPVEVNLVSVYDFCKMIADCLTWNLWADQDGKIHFENRKPFVMGAASHGQPGWDADPAPTYTIVDTEILDMAYKESEKNLRNRVVVYGLDGIHAEAKEVSPWLPTDFYKSVVASYSFIDAQSEADKTASYNLHLFHRLDTSITLTTLGNVHYMARGVYGVDSTRFGLTGSWYCYSSQHSWSRSGYQTTLELRQTIEPSEA